jgi:curved DNA-binding protein CbpA
VIKKIEDLNYYELLEVGPQATSQEIHKAYERIRRVYEPNSMALYSLFSPEETEIITRRIEEAYRTLAYEDNRKRYDALLREREEMPDLPLFAPEPSYRAHRTEPVRQSSPFPSSVTQSPENRLPDSQESPNQQSTPQNNVREPITPVSQFIADFTGPVIKMLREQHGLTLRDIANMTKIGTRYLEFIEDELYTKLPARAYVRGFLMLYAKALGCEPQRMAGDYLKRYDAAMTPKTK